MRVLVTGASGFIGAHIVGALIEAGHAVTGCARDVASAKRRCPAAGWIACDFNRSLPASFWAPHLEGVGAIVNCAGLLQGSARQSLARVHHTGPAALFDAAATAGVRRVVQISALGIEDSDTGYAATKRAGDEHLKSLDLDWIVVRPSLVYGAGAYGGSALMRGLAGFPFVTPLPGGGKTQKFQPIAMDDLARGIAGLVEPKTPARLVLDAAGPETMTLRQIVPLLRGWLGFAPAPVLAVPTGLIALGARLGDVGRWFTGRGTVTTTAIRQMEAGALGDGAGFAKASGVTLRPMAEALSTTPSQTQDRWHARIYFARPLLRITMALFWIAAGLVVARPETREQAAELLKSVGFAEAYLSPLIWSGAIVDTGLGLALLLRWRVRLVGTGMLGVSAFYLAVLSWGAPEVWFDPLGSLTKILPIMAAIVLMMALEDDR